MLARTLATLAGAVALSGVLATTASAGIEARPIIQGGGTVYDGSGNQICSQAPEVSEQSMVACPLVVAPSAPFGAYLQLKAEPAPGWQLERWLGCDSVEGNACVMVAGPRAGRVLWPTAVFEDTVVPEARYLEATASTSEERTVTAAWTPSKPNISWQCSTDTVRFVDCTSPYTVTLPEGSHTLTVRGTDVNGTVGPEAEIPVTVVDTELTAGPVPGQWIAKTGHGTAFECSLDGEPYVRCGTPGADGTATLTVPAVTDGKHTLRVRARRGDAVDLVPATRTWTVDPTPPTPASSPPSGAASALPQVAPAPKKVSFVVKYRFRKGRFTKLAVHGIPAGTKLTVSVKRPGKRATKTTLKRLIGKRLRPGTTITLRAGTAKKVLKIRHGRGPSVR